MKKLVSKTLTLTMIAGLLSVPAVQAVPDSGRTYLLYEDFNTMTAGELPGALTLETGTPASIERTTVDEENGDYAIKLTSGSSGYAVGMRLSEAIAGRQDGNDKITIEYDLKNEYGGFGLSWLTSEEIASGSQYILNKNILNLGNPSRKYFGAATTGTAYWGAPFAPHEGNGRNDENMITGDGEFTSFGKWIHVTMTLDGQSIENNDNGTPKYQNRFMNATVSWYEKDTPNVTYTVSKNGNGFQIEGADSAENHKTQNLGNIRQRDIASVVIPVAASNGEFIPTMEIDNLEVYLTNKASVESPEAPTVTSVSSVPGTNSVRVSFNKEMSDNIAYYVGLEKENGEKIISTAVTAQDKMSVVVTPAEGQSLADTIVAVVDKYAISADGGIIKSKYEGRVKSPKKYLLYEDFNTMTAGELPGALTLETGTPASIERTTVDEENGDYAIKLTSGSNGYAIGMRLSEAIAGRQDSNDKITIEYDLKNEYGGFGLSWLTSEEIASGKSQNILNKKILNLANWNAAQGYAKYFGAATTDTAYWSAPNSPHTWNDADMITGNGEFTSFGEWIHVTMTLDGQLIENNANGTPKYQDRFMNATVSWYEKDTPNVTYTVSKNGNGFRIEGAAGTENHSIQNLGNIRQRDIASVVIPVAAASSNGVSIPTMEIDNLEVYLTNNTAYAAYAGVDGLTFTINESANLTQAPAGTTAVNVNFDTAMATTAGKYISLISNGVAVPSTGAFSNDGLTYTITPSTPLSADTQYTVTVNKNALTQDGGRLVEEYTNSFVTGAGAFTVSDFAITSAGEAINALPTAGTAVNLSLTASNTISAENVWLIIAEYTDRELTGAKAEQSSIAIGTDTYSLSEDFIVSSGIDTLKAFCWTYDNLIPLTENVQITMPEAE